MIISIIAAIGENNVLGKDNQLLWHLPADFKYFKETTSGHTVIMGRKTFEAIGRPLHDRRNIIITRDINYWKNGIEVAHSLDEAFKIAGLDQGKGFEENQDEVEVFILGGGEIYKQSIDKVNKLYITEVHSLFDGDTYFPQIDTEVWQEIERKDNQPDGKNTIPYSFVIYKRRLAN